MFGFFKKKSNSITLDARSVDVASRAAAIIELNLMISRTVPDYQEKLHCDFVRGYLVGFFDASAQCANIRFNSDDEYFKYLAYSHVVLLRNDVRDPVGYALDSTLLQRQGKFGNAQNIGGTEYFDFLSNKIKSPRELEKFFHTGAL